MSKVDFLKVFLCFVVEKSLYLCLGQHFYTDFSMTGQPGRLAKGERNPPFPTPSRLPSTNRANRSRLGARASFGKRTWASPERSNGEQGVGLEPIWTHC